MVGLKNIEVEFKLPLNNSQKLISKLNESASFVGEQKQKDTYYIPSNNNFLEERPISKWLRIRESSKEVSINYKNWNNLYINYIINRTNNHFRKIIWR